MAISSATMDAFRAKFDRILCDNKELNRKNFGCYVHVYVIH